MGYTPTNQPGPIGHHFAGIAANDAHSANDMSPHEWLINWINRDIPFIIDSFHTTMASILRQMDIDYAVSKQTRMIDGERMKPGQTPEQPSVALAFHEEIPAHLWALAIQSFHDYTLQTCPKKYKSICQNMSAATAEALLDTALIQNEQASVEVGAVFQKAMLEEIEALNRLKDMIRHNIPNVHIDIEMRTQNIDEENQGPFMTPVIILTALEDLDLRVALRRYVDAPQGAGPGGLRPA